MAISSRTSNLAEKVEVEDFSLKLPDVFDINPVYIVELPKKHSALIYSIKMDDPAVKSVAEGEKHPQIDGWRLIVINKAGVVKNNNDYREFRQHYSSELNLMLNLKWWAYELSKKKRTTVRDEDED